MPPPKEKPTPITVKKYANRRLYNTDSSSYITLDHIAAMVREGRDFRVVDARSGEDITRSVLTQIIMDEENRGQTMLPISFLRQLIALYGDSMQSLVPHYLEASMEALRRNQAQFRDALTGAFGAGAFGPPPFKPFESLARQNMAMLQAAAELLSGGAIADRDGTAGADGQADEQPGAAQPGSTQPGSAQSDQPAGGQTADPTEELRRLREQMTELQAQLDRLEKR